MMKLLSKNYTNSVQVLENNHQSTIFYHNILVRKRIFIINFLIIILLISAIFSLKIGSYDIGFSELLNIIFNKSIDETKKNILINIRLTRLFSALLVGSSLAISGLILQSLLKNPLASPFTLGISQGAVFGVTLIIVLLGKINLMQYEFIKKVYPLLIILSAFIGSLFTLVMILILSLLKDARQETLILGGIAISAFFSALTMFLQYFATEIQISTIVFWTFGDLSKTKWDDILVILVIFMCAYIIFQINSWNYNAIIWGNEWAKSVGVNLKWITSLGLLLACFLTATVTSYVGIIGFIGLISPHIARSIIGNNHLYLIPATALIGAILLLYCDILSRIILKPIVVPVGIITSLIGAPFFMYLIFKKRSNT